MKTTFIERENTNNKVMEIANEKANPKNLPNKRIKKFSEYVHNKQEAMLKHSIRAENTDSLKMACFEEGTDHFPIMYSKRRVGRPKKHLIWETYKRTYLKHGLGTLDTWNLDYTSAVHSVARAAKERSI